MAYQGSVLARVLTRANGGFSGSLAGNISSLLGTLPLVCLRSGRPTLSVLPSSSDSPSEDPVPTAVAALGRRLSSW